jgi:hypothetical protein
MTQPDPRLWVRGWHATVGKVQLSIEGAENWTPAHVSLLAETVDAFVRLGARGGFAVAQAGATRSNIAVLSVSRQAAGLLLELQLERVDGRAFQVLRNMASALGEEGVKIGDIRVDAAGAADDEWLAIPLPSDTNLDDAYPQGPLELPFEVIWETDGSTRARRCVVEHINAVPPDQALAIAPWVDPWFEVIERGGFTLPDYLPGQAGSMRSGVAQFDTHSTEVALLRYCGSEALWPVLLNLVVDYHATGHPVHSLTIE